MAKAAAAVRESRASLVRIARTWTLAVGTLMKRVAAISWLDLPWATRRSTSSSRGLRPNVGALARWALIRLGNGAEERQCLGPKTWSRAHRSSGKSGRFEGFGPSAARMDATLAPRSRGTSCPGRAPPEPFGNRFVGAVAGAPPARIAGFGREQGRTIEPEIQIALQIRGAAQPAEFGGSVDIAEARSDQAEVSESIAPDRVHRRPADLVRGPCSR